MPLPFFLMSLAYLLVCPCENILRRCLKKKTGVHVPRPEHACKVVQEASTHFRSGPAR